MGTGVEAVGVQWRLHGAFLLLLCTSEHFHNREVFCFFFNNILNASGTWESTVISVVVVYSFSNART